MDKDSPKYITGSRLKGERGWTVLLIKHFLKSPDKIAKNPHYSYGGAPMKLYLIERIDDIEKTDEFKAMIESASVRKRIAQKAVATKENRIINHVKSIKINLPDISKEDLVKRAVISYNNFNKLKEKERDDYFFERATVDSDWTFLNRICINYLRHNCSRYERELENIFGKVGVGKAYDILKTRINDAILQKFTFLHPVETF